MGERTSYTPGTFCWVDLVDEDQDGAKAFYTDLFGWDYEDFPTGDDASYSIAQLDGRPVAGTTDQTERSPWRMSSGPLIRSSCCPPIRLEVHIWSHQVHIPSRNCGH